MTHSPSFAKARRPSFRTAEQTLTKLSGTLNPSPAALAPHQNENEKLLSCLQNAPDPLPSGETTSAPTTVYNYVPTTTSNKDSTSSTSDSTVYADNNDVFQCPSEQYPPQASDNARRQCTPSELAARIAQLDPFKTGKVLTLILNTAPQQAWIHRQDGAYDVDVSQIDRSLFMKLAALVELDAQGRWPNRLHQVDVAGKRRTDASSIAHPSKRPKRQGDQSRSCNSCHTHKTPTWREVEGETFCNACALRLLKLNYRCPSCGQVPHHVDLGRCCPRCQGPLKSADEI